MLPELLAYHLTGEITAELTSAGTTGLLDLATRRLVGRARRRGRAAARPAARRFALPARWSASGAVFPVHLVGGHDTASAVLGGAVDGAAFVSAGTWLLVGRMLARPDTSEAARLARLLQRAGCGRWHPPAAQRRRMVVGRGVPPVVGRSRSRRAARRRGERRSGARRRRHRCALPRSRRHGGRAVGGRPGSGDGVPGGDHPLRRRVDGAVDGRRRRPARPAERPGVRRRGAIGAAAAASSPSTSRARSRSARWRRRRSATRCPRASPSACSDRWPRPGERCASRSR